MRDVATGVDASHCQPLVGDDLDSLKRSPVQYSLHELLRCRVFLDGCTGEKTLEREIFDLGIRLLRLPSWCASSQPLNLEHGVEVHNAISLETSSDPNRSCVPFLQGVLVNRAASSAESSEASNHGHRNGAEEIVGNPEDEVEPVCAELSSFNGAKCVSYGNDVPPKTGNLEMDLGSVTCAYAACSWRGSVEEYIVHMSNCSHRRIMCTHPRCQWRGVFGDLSDHLASCEFKPRTATTCGTTARHGQSGWLRRYDKCKASLDELASARLRDVPRRRRASNTKSVPNGFIRVQCGPAYRVVPVQRAPVQAVRKHSSKSLDCCLASQETPTMNETRIDLQPALSEKVALELAIQKSAAQSSLGTCPSAQSGNRRDEATNEICPICLEAVGGVFGVAALPRCGHRYHYHCVSALPATHDAGDGDGLMCTVCREAFCWADIQRETVSGEVAPGDRSNNWRARRSRQIPRRELVKAAFRACDADNDGLLRCVELMTFACNTGFDGDEEEWAEEYAAVCEEWCLDQARGFDEQLFAEFVDDHSEKGCPCTDDELRKFLAFIPRNRPYSFLSPQCCLSPSFNTTASTAF